MLARPLLPFSRTKCGPALFCSLWPLGYGARELFPPGHKFSLETQAAGLALGYLAPSGTAELCVDKSGFGFEPRALFIPAPFFLVGGGEGKV